jgi:phage terminase large subunit GpA-like protein
MINISEIYSKAFRSIFSQNIVRDVMPSEFAEKNRVIPQGEPLPGKWNYDNSPLTREIIDVLHPDNHIRICAIMKSAQYGVSDGVIHNGIIYLIKHAPAPILLTAGDGDLVTKAMGERIPAAIRSAGLYELIRPNNQRKGKGRSSGDTLSVKQFPGGFLQGQTIQSLNKMRQTTFKVGFLDDFESAVLTNEQRDGDVFSVIKGRFTRYADQMKVFLISTPTLKDVSKIEPAFLKGDQRYWFMPCPHCGEYFRFEMFGKNSKVAKYGILYDIEENQVVQDSVRYRCPNCGNDIKETQKHELIKSGEWRPTAKPMNHTYRSYHISDLYSTFGTTWFDLAEEWNEAIKDKGKLKAFLNLRLGQIYEEKRQEVRSMIIAHNTRDYEIGTIPNHLSNQDGNGDICLVTLACDLGGHVGEDETQDDVRLDYEILAHSASGSTYSIDAGHIGTYKVGKDWDKNKNRAKYTYRHGCYNSVWPLLDEVLNKQYLTDDGGQMMISLGAIDTGYATMDVYEYLNRNPGVAFGVKGESERKVISDYTDVKLFKASNERAADCFILTESIMKDRLADFMKKPARTQPQQENTMNFPQPAGGRYTLKGYFAQYEGEVKKPEYDAGGILKGYRWEKRHSGSDDHFKDCRVYNLFARDIFVRLFVKSLKQQGAKIDENAFYWSNYCNYLNHA